MLEVKMHLQLLMNRFFFDLHTSCEADIGGYYCTSLIRTRRYDLCWGEEEEEAERSMDSGTPCRDAALQRSC